MSFNRNVPSLVLVKAEWCGHCQHFMPTWKALSQHAGADTLNMVTLDSEADKEFLSRVSTLKGYPTIYYVPQKGGAIMYRGPRDFISLVDFVNNAAGQVLINV